jgi:hypothetical protein
MSFKKAVEILQDTALRYPCELAEQCNDPRYFVDVRPTAELFARVGLTVNVGEE